ncbi:MAG: heparinase [Gammaproteobacteria bacterium]|nr:heparinase [Gammaproteobacteria bacterium]
MAWTIKRIKVMGLAEMASRVKQLLFQWGEIFLLATGWRPSVKTSTQMDRSIFSAQDLDVASIWNSQFTLDLSKLDRLVSGRVDIFSYENVELGHPIDWLKEPVSGIKSPSRYGKGINYREKKQVGDIKVVWELGRHQHLVPLAIGYLLTGNPAYKETLAEHIRSWIVSCPFGYTVHWCSSLEVALRGISWSIVHSLLLLSGEKRGLFSLLGDENHLRDALYQHAWFIRHNLSSYSSANNHLIGELTGLWTLCTVFDFGSCGRNWAGYAKMCLEEEAVKQVYPDGVDKEQAIYYHYWVLEYLLFSSLVGQVAGQAFSDRYTHTIENMARFLETLIPVGGVPPQIGDADDGCVAPFMISRRDSPFFDVLSACKMMNNKEYILTETSFWYSLMAAKNPAEIIENRVSDVVNLPCFFEEGGYAVLGDDTTHIVFDAGPLGYTSIAAHGHADALSICLALDGVWWLVDPGTYIYHDNPEWRNYFRSTAAHNTVVVDNTDQSKIGGDFLWLDHASAQLVGHGVEDVKQWVTGTHDGYAKIGVTHVRKVEYFECEHRIVISDVLEGNGVHHLDWHWHLHPDVFSTWDDDSDSWILTHRNRHKKVKLSCDMDVATEMVKGSVSPIAGWYSSQLGSKTASEVLVYRVSGMLPCKLIFTFILE